jgi:Escherichia/Staphylococcus phage prohead protease
VIAMIEHRSIVGEVRATNEGRRLSGYAATFNTETRIGDFVEVIAPGAFANSLAKNGHSAPGARKDLGDILALFDHDASRLLARTRSGTLRLKEDARGLVFDLDLPETSDGVDVSVLAARRDLGGMSFGFSVKREKWDGERRTLEAVDLHEISVVKSWPAYPNTVVQVRSRPVVFPSVAVARRYLESL